MKCCMPLCENTSEKFSKCGRITFHGFPSETSLRAAWLRALGKQDSQLPDSAVVCSQHFLHDDICETESGSRQLRTGAVPSTVLVCMICLNTDSKMSPISQYNLKAAYEKLTGHPLWDGGHLKQTLCVQCVQKLRNFSRFREQSLRARFLMMELLEKHDLITIQHLNMIQCGHNKLRNNLVSTTLSPDSSDMFKVEDNSDEGRHNSEETVLGVAVKTECSDDSQWEDEDTQMIIEDNADCVEDVTLYSSKDESALFMCAVCCEGLPHEHAYSTHVRMHAHGDAHPAASPAHSAVTPDTTQHSERSLAADSDHRTHTDLNSCVVVLYDIFKYPQYAKVKVESSPQALQAVSSRDSLKAHTNCDQHRAASEDRVAATHDEPAASVPSDTEPGTSGHSSHTHTFTCDVGERAFKRKAGHMKSHTDKRPYPCNICSYKFESKAHLVIHMRTHTGEKPYSCEICSFKFTMKNSLVQHMRTHTGEKPYSCETCCFKSAKKGDLVRHMRTHTGEKPYSCETCCYKSANKSTLVKHMRTHTREKPYFCEICSFKFTMKNSLVQHMRTHTGEKPYSCETCCYKSAKKGDLVRHMRTHTGEKPYSCETCCYKSANKSNLVKHMSTHTREKPYSCKICSFKFTMKNSLVQHMRTHTGEKPYSCETCSYKFAYKSNLIAHMRTHTGEKPYSCKICSFKFTMKNSLVQHMRTHTGEKPYSCEICRYKSTLKCNLVQHMRTHTGEKPYSCEICRYKCTTKSSLVRHMRTHTS